MSQGEARQTGEVRKWILDKGFGFISVAQDNGYDGQDIFVHRTAIGDREFLNIGETVTFDMEFDERSGKDRASNVEGNNQGTPPTAYAPDERQGGGRSYGGGYGNGGDSYGGRGGGDSYGGRGGDSYGGRGGGDSYGGRGGGDSYGGGTKICYQFRDGNCGYGDRCRFSHDLEGAGGSGGGGGGRNYGSSYGNEGRSDTGGSWRR